MAQSYVKKGMILCAGLGTRLLPITKTLPKPLVPILNIENVLFNIKLLENAGISEIIVNLHHLAEPLESFLSQDQRIKSKIIFSKEEIILGTGGGVKKAEPFFNGEPFVLANCDFVTNINLEAVIEYHKTKKNLATMVLIQDEHRQHKYSKVGVDTKGNICSLPKLETKKPEDLGIFTGIHVIESSCLRYLKSSPCGINDLMYPALMKETPSKVGAYIDKEHYWYDTGEVDTFLSSSAGLLNELNKNPSLLEQPLVEHFKGVWGPKQMKVSNSVKFQGNVLLGKDITLEENILIGPNVTIGDGCRISSNSKLSDCVVFKGSVVPENSDLRECLLYGKDILKPK